jgi:hypothetical protein
MGLRDACSRLPKSGPRPANEWHALAVREAIADFGHHISSCRGRRRTQPRVVLHTTAPVSDPTDPVMVMSNTPLPEARMGPRYGCGDVRRPYVHNGNDSGCFNTFGALSSVHP